MDSLLVPLVDAFSGQRVLVVGDAMLDSYLEGSSGRLCREAPVPNVRLFARKDVPGGAANVAVNVRALGGVVTFLSAIGGDREGRLLRRALAARGVSSQHVLSCTGRSTLVKHRIVADAQILLRLDQGDTDPITAATEEALIERLGRLLPACDAVIVSDYDCGVLGPRLIEALTRLQRLTPRILVVDSRCRLPAFRQAGVAAVKPNYYEAVELLADALPDPSGARAQQIAEQAESILERTGAQLAAVTLDHEGAVLLERGQAPYRTYAGPARHSCVAGAGDTFTSALTLAVAAGASARAAGDLASAASAVVVAKEGTAVCSAQELREYLCSLGKYMPDLLRLATRVDYYRQQGKRIVFTNGCFDILHRGHVAFLNHARGLGDVLVVAVNGDAGIRRLKGLGRPVNTLEDRIEVLAALDCIDHLIGFEEDTAHHLIRALRPHVFAKGGNYRPTQIAEAALVEAQRGVVEILPYLPDCSTTQLIGRIRARAGGDSCLPASATTADIAARGLS
jgi:D-beta-D-heptose 7-phosphate kinase/D-beta-D-heptose 1-phosphate adenosyltransferase